MSNSDERENQSICPIPSGEQTGAESGPSSPIIPDGEKATSSSLPFSSFEILAAVEIAHLKSLVEKKDRVLEEIVGLSGQVDSLMGVLIGNTAQRGRDYR